MSTKRTHSRRPLVIISLLVVIGLIALVLWGIFLTRSFKSGYKSFIVAEEAYKDSAMRPAMPDNPLRREIGFLLAQSIQVDMAPGERIRIANRGIALLNELEAQIDDIKDKGDTVAPIVDSLDSHARAFGDIVGRSEKMQIVALAKKNAEIISDIRGLSYRADYYTGEVFERVIDDQGLMTDEHKTYLNGLIPQLEEQFNKRQNLYSELATNMATIKELALALGYTE